MHLDRTALAGLLPHSGSMVLIDNVVAWSEKKLVCETRRHLDASFPLKEYDVVPASAGIELAAQAMAIHVALVRDDGPKQGLLTHVKNICFGNSSLNDASDLLTIEVRADRIGIRGCSYSFEIKSGGAACLNGRVGVVLV